MMNARTNREGLDPVSLLRALAADGYRTDLRSLADAKVMLGADGPVKPAKDLLVERFYRFEGPSSPDDSSVVAAVCWDTPEGKQKGALMLGYGSSADPNDGAVLEALDTSACYHADDADQAGSD